MRERLRVELNLYLPQSVFCMLAMVRRDNLVRRASEVGNKMVLEKDRLSPECALKVSQCMVPERVLEPLRS